MPRFKIERPVKLGGKIRKDGEVTLDQEDAEPLVTSGSLAPLDAVLIGGAAGDAVTFAEAIAKLDPNNPDHWMKSNGAPDLKALEKIGGLKLKAAERDSLWAEHLKAQEVEGYWVSAKEGTVQWGEMAIDEDGVGFDLDGLTEEQVAELEAREDLIIAQGTFAGIAAQEGGDNGAA
ncbi:hypothetical protein [uncultured Alcanivorax sp.]|jgi:hypothetical protein|uniref:hypothetical protein n=1 Tax=uncultured Alcanivorax sp. TaxID=191215 RepID=UPI0025ED7EEC|nr:hypothetical protein [uncultured Alcanivorax sp.]